jgi:hypothetical protein
MGPPEGAPVWAQQRKRPIRARSAREIVFFMV